MMIGEFDFNDIFHPDDPDAADSIQFPNTSYVIFIAFLVLMAIIVMNLLVREAAFLLHLIPLVHTLV